jgi:hypothetical protein
MKVGLFILLGLLVSACAEPQIGDEDADAPVYAKIRSVFSEQGSSEFRDSLANPHPNPFKFGDTSIFISFTLTDSAKVKVIIQNPIGDSVAFFEDDVLPAGAYAGWWVPENPAGRPLRAGLYFVTLRADPDKRNYIDSKLLYIENND